MLFIFCYLINFCNMEVPHFQIEKCQIWWGSVSWMYHFNSMPFHEVGVVLTFQLKAISEKEDNDIFSIVCHLRMGGATISIWCNFGELRRRRYHSQISCTFSAAAGAIIWYAGPATNQMKRKMHGRGLEDFAFLWAIAHWTYELIAHIVAHKETLKIPSPTHHHHHHKIRFPG